MAGRPRRGQRASGAVRHRGHAAPGARAHALVGHRELQGGADRAHAAGSAGSIHRRRTREHAPHGAGGADCTGDRLRVQRASNRHSTGNFVEIAQRVPVRIELDPGQSLAERPVRASPSWSGWTPRSGGRGSAMRPQSSGPPARGDARSGVRRKEHPRGREGDGPRGVALGGGRGRGRRSELVAELRRSRASASVIQRARAQHEHRYRHRLASRAAAQARLGRAALFPTSMSGAARRCKTMSRSARRRCRRRRSRSSRCPTRSTSGAPAQARLRRPAALEASTAARDGVALTVGLDRARLRRAALARRSARAHARHAEVARRAAGPPGARRRGLQRRARDRARLRPSTRRRRSAPRARARDRQAESALRVLLGETPARLPAAARSRARAPRGAGRVALRAHAPAADIAEAEATLAATDASYAAARVPVPAPGASRRVDRQPSRAPRSRTIPQRSGAWAAAYSRRSSTGAACVLRPMRPRRSAIRRPRAYRGVALVAFAEVEGGLEAVQRLEEQGEHTRAQRDVLARALRLAHDRYHAGYASYIEELDAQRGLFTAQLAVVEIADSQLTRRSASTRHWVAAGHDPSAPNDVRGSAGRLSCCSDARGTSKPATWEADALLHRVRWAPPVCHHSSTVRRVSSAEARTEYDAWSPLAPFHCGGLFWTDTLAGCPRRR